MVAASSSMTRTQQRFLVVRCTGPGGRKLSGVSFRVRVERADDSDTNGPSAITRGPGEYWLPFTPSLGLKWEF